MIELLMAGALFLTPLAGGSDSPTPYTVGVEGISFPKPLEAHGHVNIRTEQGSFGVHLDPNNGHPGGQWIGKDFMPWSAFSDAPLCVSWVQVSGFNQHFGEGGQEPVGPGCGPSVEEPEPEPTPEPTPEPEPEPTPEPEPEPTDPEPEEPTEEPSPEPEPTEDPEPTVPEQPDPWVVADKTYDCDAGTITVVEYTFGWLWDGDMWVTDEGQITDEYTAPIEDGVCDTPAPPVVDEQPEPETPAVVEPEEPVTTEAKTETPEPKTQPKPVVKEVAVKPVGEELAETGASIKGLVIVAALFISAGTALVVERRRRGVPPRDVPRV